VNNKVILVLQNAYFEMPGLPIYEDAVVTADEIVIVEDCLLEEILPTAERVNWEVYHPWIDRDLQRRLREVLVPKTRWCNRNAGTNYGEQRQAQKPKHPDTIFMYAQVQT
jgi:hypothetical protein